MAAHSVQPLQDSLEVLEKTLEPLFEKELHETLDQMDHLDQAKLCAVLPYVVDQLLISFMRAKGVKEEEQEPLYSELKRVKDYFRKIPWTSGPDEGGHDSEPNLRLDKEAANRFITAALAGISKSQKEEQVNLGIDGPTQSSHFNWKPRERGPDEQPPQLEGGMHTRFAHIKSVLEEDDSQESSEDEDPPSTVKKTSLPPSTTESKKRKRPDIDPFYGYDTQQSRSKTSKHKKRDSSTGITKPEPGLVNTLTYMDVENGPPTMSERNERVTNPVGEKKSKRKSKKEKGSKFDSHSVTDPSM
ncbi:hypothetical protein FRC17_010011 [Serendipita sp. 399]|nr:hypothetical protein FRC17_010011 [Serendipita sp. 399]